jgi:putative transposase
MYNCRLDRSFYPKRVQGYYYRFIGFCIKEKGLVLNGWVLMTNHIHFVGRCEAPYTMSDCLRDFKKFTSKKLASAINDMPESRSEWILDKFNFEARKLQRAKNFKIWQDHNHPIEMSDIDIFEKLAYIHDNPVRAGIVDCPEYYLYSSAIDYAGGKGLLPIEKV